MCPKYNGPLSPHTTESGSGSQPRAAFALVVERDPDVRANACDALARGYRLQTAQSAELGLPLARELQPEIVVTDAQDDFELCRQLRHDARTKSLPVIVLVRGRDPEAIDGAFRAGANDCVVVPFRPSELVARVDVHARLRRLAGQLARQERMAALGSLAASVAHNVRNPLSALITGLPTVRRRVGDQIDPCTGELLEIMLDCAERIELITHDLLDLSRLDRETCGPFAPGNGLLACTRMFVARFSERSVELDSDVDVIAVISGRAGDINHVFMNVLDNALRAIHGSGRISVRGAVSGDEYVVTIGDSVPGIDPAALSGIFEPYWTTRPTGEGTGLGLAIARQIVEEHGGTIEAGRSPLGGAEFVIRLPLRRVDRVA